MTRHMTRRMTGVMRAIVAETQQLAATLRVVVPRVNQLIQLLLGLVLIGLVDLYSLTLAREAVTLGRQAPWQLIALPLVATILWGIVATVNIRQLVATGRDKA